MLNIISTCQDILCVDINVDKRCVDHSTNRNANTNYSLMWLDLQYHVLNATKDPWCNQWCVWGGCSQDLPKFPDGLDVHPEDQIEEENENNLGKIIEE